MRSFLDKHGSNAIKGIAIICMFVHHILTIPEWAIDSVSYPVSQGFVDLFHTPLKLSVGLYAFITGYAYYFVKTKDLSYSKKKIFSFLKIFWAIFVPLFLMGVMFGCYEFEFPTFFLELLALRRPVMYFAWYVYFYIITMLLLPLIVKVCKDKPIPMAIVGILGISLICSLLMNVSDNTIYLRVLSDVRNNFATVICGYLTSKLGLFEKLKKLTDKVVWWVRIPAFLGLALHVFFVRNVREEFTFSLIKANAFSLDLLINIDVVCAFFFIFTVIELLHELKNSLLMNVLEFLGKYSVYMWFFHCMFFNVCKEFTQPYLYISDNPVVVLLWGLAINLLLAILMDFVFDKKGFEKRQKERKERRAMSRYYY